MCISSGTEAGCEDALNKAYGSSALKFICMKVDSDEQCLEDIKDSKQDVSVVGGVCSKYFALAPLCLLMLYIGISWWCACLSMLMSFVCTYV